MIQNSLLRKVGSFVLNVEFIWFLAVWGFQYT